MLSGGACCFLIWLFLAACVHDGCVHFVILHPPAPFFLHWKYVVNFECPHALLIGVVCRPITSSFRGLFLCGVFAQPFIAALIGVVISYCVALASGVFLDLAFSAPFSYLYLVLLPDGLSNVAHRWCSFLIYLFCLCPQPFSFHFLWVYSHTSHRRRFLPYPYFLKRCVPMRRLSAESLCGLSSLCILLSTVFSDLPLSMPFSQFSFFPSHRGRFILHCPLSFIRLLLTAFSFWRIYSHPSFSDVALPLTQRREFAKRGVWRAIGARAHLMHFLSLWKNSYHKCGSLFRNFIL